MELLLLLLTAHFIADFYLQPKHWVSCRNQNHIKSPGLWRHTLVHALLYMLVMVIASKGLLLSAIAVAVLAASHFLIDLFKSYLKANLTYFLLDQVCHILFIVLVWAILSNITANQALSFLKGLFSNQNIVYAIAYILVCKPASVIISLALKRHTDVLKRQAQAPARMTQVEVKGDIKEQLTVTIHPQENQGPEKASQQPTQDDIGLISAGAWIGYIERCLAITFIFMGQFSGIGFLVATKTIFRFGDLTKNKDMKLTEYMMLGTLISFAIALLVGWSTVKIIAKL